MIIAINNNNEIVPFLSVSGDTQPASFTYQFYTVLTSSDTKLFLAQDKSEIEYLKEVFKLSEGEANYLITAQKGEGLFKVGNDTAILKIIPTKKEFEFVETNLNKLNRMQDMKKESI